MKKIKTSDLSGAALNTAVHNLAFPDVPINDDCTAPPYSTDWAFGGPIIDQEKIGVGYTTEGGATWLAAKTDDPFYISGPTPLIAAMRCFVASKLGDEVEVPEEG
jgi:hypothetical protein